MCFMLYLGSVRPLPAPDARYPWLAVAAITDATAFNAADVTAIDAAVRSTPRLELLRRARPDLQYVYEVALEGLCGCYFEHADRAELEHELQQASESDMQGWVSNIAYPDLDPRAAARRWWDRKHHAVFSFGHYLHDHADDGSLVLYVTWADDEGVVPPLAQQTITPAYFSQAERLALPEHMLFTIVPERTE